MIVRGVLDASVLAKCLFEEEDSALAREAVRAAGGLIAPDFIFVELASIAAKKVRRREERAGYAADAMRHAEVLLAEVRPTRPLAAAAFDLAVNWGVSVYDGLYVALAIEEDGFVLTADLRLAGRMERAGAGERVRDFRSGASGWPG